MLAGAKHVFEASYSTFTHLTTFNNMQRHATPNTLHNTKRLHAAVKFQPAEASGSRPDRLIFRHTGLEPTTSKSLSQSLPPPVVSHSQASSIKQPDKVSLLVLILVPASQTADLWFRFFFFLLVILIVWTSIKEGKQLGLNSQPSRSNSRSATSFNGWAKGRCDFPNFSFLIFRVPTKE